MRRLATRSKLAQIVAIAVALSCATLASSVATSSAKSAATLGLALSDSGTSGFGAVAPSVIDLGGDPTSMVSKVHWAHWGAKRAIGTGVADWVWPGWSVAAGSENLKATVVAYDLGSCGGHSAYRAVEWYFPSRGMKFDRKLAWIDLCSGHLVSGEKTAPPLRTCATSTLSTATGNFSVTNGETSNFPNAPTCAVLRTVVRQSRAAAHFGKNARWHSGSWWCGSELSMSSGSGQSYSCQRGDFDALSFNLERKPV